MKNTILLNLMTALSVYSRAEAYSYGPNPSACGTMKPCSGMTGGALAQSSSPPYSITFDQACYSPTANKLSGKPPKKITIICRMYLDLNALFIKLER